MSQSLAFTILSDELRRRCREAGYGDIIVGACDVMALNKDGLSYCEAGHKENPSIGGRPALWVIVEDLIGMSSGSCHWCGFKRREEMSEGIKFALKGAPFYWANDHYADIYEARKQAQEARYNDPLR